MAQGVESTVYVLSGESDGWDDNMGGVRRWVLNLLLVRVVV